MNVLAQAANDHLGAYSSDLRQSTPGEMRVIDELFSSVGPYCAFSIVPGSVPTCPVCREYDHRNFSSWFYGVAWDYCYLVTWPKSELIWMGCLTDTD
jgi:hypothetical protein